MPLNDPNKEIANELADMIESEAGSIADALHNELASVLMGRKTLKHVNANRITKMIVEMLVPEIARAVHSAIQEERESRYG